jgi:hypothetical protein
MTRQLNRQPFDEQAADELLEILQAAHRRLDERDRLRAGLDPSIPPGPTELLMRHSRSHLRLVR